MLRLPGFWHMKNPNAPHLVRVVGGNRRRYNSLKFLTPSRPSKGYRSRHNVDGVRAPTATGASVMPSSAFPRMTARPGCVSAWRFATTTEMAAERFGTNGAATSREMSSRGHKSASGNHSSEAA